MSLSTPSKNVKKRKKTTGSKRTEFEEKRSQKLVQSVSTVSDGPPAQTTETEQDVFEENHASQEQCVLISKEDCKPRPFDQEGIDFFICETQNPAA